MNKYYFQSKKLIFQSFILVLLLQIMPWPQIIYILHPSWFLLFLIYWVLALPYFINVTSGFLLGILTDVTSGSKLGVSALVFSITSYLIADKFQFIRNLKLWKQIFCVMLISMSINVAIFIVEYLTIRASFRYEIFLNSIINGLVWPLFFLLLEKFYYN
ncbi:rod shape-determining protein MreD [Candidatus Pantoea edessiphila]|uniref:Rod shape-determining protein MreD n=1 Tax=Candidatus Pantoea edessiphila TaxID=2044610 RepID=A0A2P5SVR9_9GAMM|nr:rod shape-determining protein MreD [Candidatus Pantoea edessiphila]PPI86435.1 rod shape-determining protein MreD [Candidatus Pantoea edessiphila]